jgi:hypothetical protein
MNEKEYNNTFKFSLTQGNLLLCEKIFDADKFNPFTRYSIDIRDILPRAITKLQKVLSKKKYDIIFEVGRKDQTIENSENYYYDLYHHAQNILDSYPQQIKNDLRYNPQTIIQQIDDKIIRGVECKIGLYIIKKDTDENSLQNESTIVERKFYVDGYNPVARWSVDMVNSVVEISDAIQEKIKCIDIKNMWDDYYLINTRGLIINQIRVLSSSRREELLGKNEKI